MHGCPNKNASGTNTGLKGDHAGAPARTRPPCAGPCRSTAPFDRLWKQLLPGLGILDEDRADRTVLRRLQDLLDSVACRIDGFRLALLVEPKHLWGDRLAHGIPDADVVVYPDAQFASHWASPIARRPAKTSVTGT